MAQQPTNKSSTPQKSGLQTQTQAAQTDQKQVRRPPAFKISTYEKHDRYLKMLVYGEYGTGKTTLAGSAAAVDSMQDVMLIDAEGGDISLDGVEEHFPGATNHIDVVRATSYQAAARVQEFLKQHHALRKAGDMDKVKQLEEFFRGEEVDEPRMYNTAIIDSISEVEAYCMYALLGITERTRLDDELPVAEWGDFRRNKNTIERFIRAFRDLPMNVIFTCPAQYVQDEQKRRFFQPALTGQLGRSIQGFMDVVGYIVTGSIDDEGRVPRRLWVQPAGKFAAKCRFARFRGTHFDNPTMEGILKAVGLLK